MDGGNGSKTIVYNTIYQYLYPRFRLAFSPTLYKFIVRAFWAWVHSCSGFKSKLALTIGNSESVQIWKDKLVPKPNTYKITTPINPLLYNEKVSTLIDKERAVWKTKMINSFFLPHDVESILAIPLSSTSPVDQKVRSATANGVFSICSAYRISHRQLTKFEVGECLSINTRMISLWKLVWHLRCLNKIKNFI